MTELDKFFVAWAMAIEDPEEKAYSLNRLRERFEAERESEKRATERRTWLETLPAAERTRAEEERREQHKRLEQSFFNSFPEFEHETAAPSNK